MDTAIWQVYKDEGLVVWAIGSQDSLESLQTYNEQVGLTYPMLHDAEGVVHADYQINDKYTNAPYPQDWIIGVDGRVIYVSNAYHPESMVELIENELELHPAEP